MGIDIFCVSNTSTFLPASILGFTKSAKFTASEEFTVPSEVKMVHEMVSGWRSRWRSQWRWQW